MSDRLKDFAMRLLDEQVASLREENGRLKEAIRRLEDQDATLSVCDGNVTVTMDATLTDEEREAIEAAIDYLEASSSPVQNRRADTLRGLLEKTGREHAGE